MREGCVEATFDRNPMGLEGSVQIMQRCAPMHVIPACLVCRLSDLCLWYMPTQDPLQDSALLGQGTDVVTRVKVVTYRLRRGTIRHGRWSAAIDRMIWQVSAFMECMIGFVSAEIMGHQMRAHVPIRLSDMCLMPVTLVPSVIRQWSQWAVPSSPHLVRRKGVGDYCPRMFLKLHFRRI